MQHYERLGNSEEGERRKVNLVAKARDDEKSTEETEKEPIFRGKARRLIR